MSFWTDKTRVEVLKDLWRQGHSANQIARMMGAGSRNVIIGKVHRLGLAQRAPRKLTWTREQRAVIKAKRKAAKTKPAPKVTQRTIVAEVKADPEVQALLERSTADVALVHGLENLESNHCKYVVGEPAEQNYCGHERVPGLPYCKTHAARCFGREQPQQPTPAVKAVIRYEVRRFEDFEEVA